jgi:hypothetical protein
MKGYVAGSETYVNEFLQGDRTQAFTDLPVSEVEGVDRAQLLSTPNSFVRGMNECSDDLARLGCLASKDLVCKQLKYPIGGPAFCLTYKTGIITTDARRFLRRTFAADAVIHAHAVKQQGAVVREHQGIDQQTLGSFLRQPCIRPEAVRTVNGTAGAQNMLRHHYPRLKDALHQGHYCVLCQTASKGDMRHRLMCDHVGVQEANLAVLTKINDHFSAFAQKGCFKLEDLPARNVARREVCGVNQSLAFVSKLGLWGPLKDAISAYQDHEQRLCGHYGDVTTMRKERAVDLGYRGILPKELREVLRKCWRLTAADQDKTPPPAVGCRVNEFLLALTNIIVDAMHDQWVVYASCLQAAFARQGIDKWKAREVPLDERDGDIGGTDADAQVEGVIIAAQFRRTYGERCCRANEVCQGAPVTVPDIRCPGCSTLEDNSTPFTGL